MGFASVPSIKGLIPKPPEPPPLPLTSGSISLPDGTVISYKPDKITVSADVADFKMELEYPIKVVEFDVLSGPTAMVDDLTEFFTSFGYLTADGLTGSISIGGQTVDFDQQTMTITPSGTGFKLEMSNGGPSVDIGINLESLNPAEDIVGAMKGFIFQLGYSI